MEEQKFVKIPSKLEEFALKFEKTLPTLKPWEKSQFKAFVGLINTILAKKNLRINDITRDLRNGFLLYKILGVFTKLDFSIPSRETRTVFDCFDNMAKIFKFLKSKHTLKTLNETEIVEGKEIKPYLAILWHLICFYHLEKIANIDAEVHSSERKGSKGNKAGSSSEKETLQHLLNWCNEKVKGKLILKNFTKDFQNGKAFAYILNSLKPDSVRGEDLISDDAVQTLENVFMKAKELCNIESILDAEVFAKNPDKESNVAYLSLFQAFEKYELSKGADTEKHRKETSKLKTLLKEEKGKIAELESDLTNCQKNLSSSKEEIDLLKKEILYMQEKLSKLESENKYFGKQIEHLNESIRERDRIIEQKDMRIREQTKKSREDEKLLLELRNMNSELSERLSEKKAADETREQFTFKDPSELEFEKMLNELDVPLRIPLIADFANANLTLLSETQKSKSSSSSKVEKWLCSSCSYWNVKGDTLCRNCFFIGKQEYKSKKKKIEPSDFFKNTILLEDPLSYHTTYVFFVKKRKHILKFEHDPVNEYRRLIFDGNVLHIKKKGIFSNPNATYEFFCSGMPSHLSIKTERTKFGELHYIYDFRIDGRSFEKYKEDYFRKRGVIIPVKS